MRFGINVQPIAGCFISEPLVKYAKDYNRVILDYVAAKFGPTAFVACENEAQRRYEESRKSATAKQRQ